MKIIFTFLMVVPLFQALGVEPPLNKDLKTALVPPLENPSITPCTQVGFYPKGSKRAVVNGVQSDKFEIRNSAGATLFHGVLGRKFQIVNQGID